MRTDRCAQSGFTIEQYEQLTDLQQAALNAVAQHLSEAPWPEEGLTDDHLAETFKLLRPCQGCVPEEEMGDDLVAAIRRKFRAVYDAGLELAEQELKQPGASPVADFSFCLILAARRDDRTEVAVLDDQQPVCYLHEQVKAWQFHFASLAELADEVVRVRDHLVHQVRRWCRPGRPGQLCVVVEGGLVTDVVGISSGLEVLVLDYDVEGADEAELDASPLDGKPCHLQRF